MNHIKYKNIFSISESYFDQLILFIIFFLFIVSTILPVDGNALNYAVHIFIFPILIIYLLMIKQIQTKQYHIVLILSFITLLFIAFYPPIQTSTLYFRFFILKIILLSLFMSSTKLNIQNFSYILNLSYLIYLTLSMLVWFKLMPGYDYGHVNSFMINIGSFKIETLYGISGSTADIDVYSGLIFLWNIFIYKGKYKYVLIFISFTALLLTFRNTPIIALILSAIVYFLIRNKVFALLSLVGLIVGFSSVIWLLYFIPDNQVPLLSGNKTWYEFFWYATHARSSLWVQQFMIYLNNYTWYDYIVGPDLKNMTVSFIRPDGHELHETFNPHNSYFIAFYRSSISTIILLLLFLTYAMKTFNRQTFPLIFFIATSAITNSSLFGLENPTYILIILFIFTQNIFPNHHNKGLK